MRKCNKLFKERAGSCTTKKERIFAPYYANFMANSKPFQLACNHLLVRLLKGAGVWKEQTYENI